MDFTAGLLIGLFVGGPLCFLTCAILTVGKVDNAKREAYWLYSARVNQCPTCGEMRTETEANDGECGSCGAAGFKNTGTEYKLDVRV